MYRLNNHEILVHDVFVVVPKTWMLSIKHMSDCEPITCIVSSVC